MKVLSTLENGGIEGKLDEINQTLGGLAAPAANRVEYNNVASGLTAANVQGAIDEVDAKVDNNATQINDLDADKADKISPTEITVNTGFAAGWSGSIKYGKTQENIIFVKIEDLQKTSDISTTPEVIYTLPVGYRPIGVQRLSVIGLNASAIRINGSMLDVLITNNGTLNICNNGSVTANVRRLAGAQVIGI